MGQMEIRTFYFSFININKSCVDSVQHGRLQCTASHVHTPCLSHGVQQSMSCMKPLFRRSLNLLMGEIKPLSLTSLQQMRMTMGTLTMGTMTQTLVLKVTSLMWLRQLHLQMPIIPMIALT